MNHVKTKILVFHPALAPYRVDLFRALGEKFDLKVVFSRSNVRGQDFDQESLVERLGVQHGYLRRGFSVKNRDIRFGLGDEIRLFSPEVVITSEFSFETVSILLKRIFGRRKYRHIVWTDDNPEFVESDSLLRRVVRWVALSRIDGLILLSEEVETYYKSVFRNIKPTVTVPILQEESYFREQLALASNKVSDLALFHGLIGAKVVLYVGRLAPEKRIDRLIHAFYEVRKEHQSVFLAIVGSGEMRSELESLSDELGLRACVLFPGREEGLSLAAWFRLGSVFVLCSDKEPFGAVVNESLLAGMPVVCTRKAGARILVHDSKNGFVVDPGNKDELSEAILRCLGTTASIGIEDMSFVKPSLMRDTFNSRLHSLVQFIESINDVTPILTDDPSNL